MLRKGGDIIRIKVFVNGVFCSLETAIASGFVVIEDCMIIPQDNVQIRCSSSIFDINDNEIFEQDIVVDESGKRFEICFQNGAFFAVEKEKSKSAKGIPLFLLQSKKHIPATIIE